MSGIARGDLSSLEQDAVLELLQMSKAGRVDFVTSEVTREESTGSHAPLAPHKAIYLLLCDVPMVATVQPRSMQTIVRPRSRR